MKRFFDIFDSLSNQQKKLLEGIHVEHLTMSHQQVMPATCFFAVAGLKHDGHDFIPEAIEAGAQVVVMSRPCVLPEHVLGIVVEDVRKIYARCASRFFGDPSQKLKLVGVTGTNGKTSITYLLESILREAGHRPGVIGTVSYRYAGKTFEASHTTPDAFVLQKHLADMLAHNVDVCVMEVSSHALTQSRLEGCDFDVAVFTNLTQEHLDYHHHMHDYFEAKNILFTHLLSSSSKKTFAVVNDDDEYGKKISPAKTVECFRYGKNQTADLSLVSCEKSESGSKLWFSFLGKSFSFTVPLVGSFNAYNVAAAFLAAHALGVSSKNILHSLSHVHPIPGRLERVCADSAYAVYVDYAHTPDALENILSTLRDITEGRLLLVFGCGGDRDKQKRPVMGEVAAKYANLVVLTSDNPRTENPLSIMEQVFPGLRKKMKAFNGSCGFIQEVDRKKAIETAVMHMTENDILVVAGKGHEQYQIIGNTKHHFDDREEVMEALKKKRKNRLVA
ncbi:MAG: UDP-N-acetylmuramoyl-L-alanyl-D-glutamate--2,6-diaminopimelate ligase [Deltaproteobacteria bacterium CG_4_10_14_0_2_um_filter_43_8]|nr:MAG: UDP-N-acetylmuramoyl-L-alanyl-D-glutamate--2,6-diaminopimelate ligase [Deltaproteobacteria bacterium CG11_big_fil_rev_8_21_14_0_20_42_23]PJA18360.1 MAG: UDP-N-acetylmuramoyl-L-alanyl-D-glutamate--2,6-diaminopimelate ligase [Deltaproteobacteria bacterium CG_4_10_14_0_2_um_filter_43_8]PJC65103.1 MAG: UDP-N-acetylmuramoyl-L-alanyl-D-glutamate--2,6-diaminopimelate ligase [Deltaproteobacteria bacterium CG_4_9_14_0_2_um_filter_42_21]